MFVEAEFRITSTERRLRANRSGVSIMELLVALGLTAIAATAILILSFSTGRSLAEMVNYIDLDHYNRVALDNLTRDLRQVSYITSFSPTAVTFADKDGTPLSYVYTPAKGTLECFKNGQLSKRLLDQCDRLQFAIYQRSPVSNRYDLIPTTVLTNCKVVTVTWSCSRTIFGIKANTEQGQTAKVVIRNKKEL
jgi:hypothetical protein